MTKFNQVVSSIKFSLLFICVILFAHNEGFSTGKKNILSSNNRAGETELGFRRQGTFPSTDIEAAFDFEFFWNITDSTGGVSLTGVVWTGTEWWFSRWNSDTLYRTDPNGGFLPSFVVPGVTGTRSLTTDGTFIYAGGAGNTIARINPTTKTLVSTITLAAGNVGSRMCAYDPNANAGAGGFWIGNFTSDIQLVSMTGTILTTVTQATHGFVGIYGGAVDVSNVAGPYLLVYHQGPPSNNSIGWLNLNTLLPATYILDVTPFISVPIQPAPNAPLAGGLFVSQTLIPGQTTMYAVSQGHEMTAIEAPDSVPFAPPPPSPANDDICNAAEFVVNSGLISTTNTLATAEVGEPAGSCWFGGDGVQNSIWYYFVATAADATISTDFVGAGTNNDTQLTGYTSSGGCNGTLTEIGCNDDVSGTNLLSTLVLSGLSAGDTIWVQIDGWNGTVGTFNLNITSTVSPTNNDDICNAIPTVLDTIYPGDNSIATTEVGEPTGTCFSDGSLDNTVWYSFVAPVSGTFRTSTDFLGGTNNDTQLAAYLSSGGCTGTLTQIGCDDDGGTLVNFNSIMDFSATAGQTVWIQVDGWNNPPAAAGTFSIQTTLLQLANQYDASLDNAVTEATGIGGYALVPNSQYNNGDVDFILNVENLGTTAVTGVTVNGSITPGGSSVTGSVATIAGFGSDVVSTNSFTASNTTSYTASFTVSINETDADPTNNTSVLAFTSGTTSDSVMARENETVSTIGLGFTGGTGRLANTYRVNNSDTLTSITVYFDGDPAGKTFELFIADYSNGVGSTELWNSGPISGISGANSFFTFGTGGVILPAGNYMIGVNQTGTVNIAVGLSTVVFRPATAFFGALGAFSPVESIGNPLFDGSFMIRPNFGPTPAVPTNNDDICNAIPTVLDTIYPGDNSIATTEVGEPTGTCFSDGSLDNTVWYSFVAPVSGTFRTSTDFLGGTNNDTQLAAYLSSGGCTGTLTQIGCDDDGGTLVNFNSIMDFSATAGQTVWIQVDGWNNPPAAAGTFSIQTTLLQLANQYDASLDNAVTEATGIGGYALVPNSQYNNGDVDFILNVENLGTTAVTGVTVNGSITPGGSSVTGSVATIAGFGSDVVSTNSFTASNTTSYTASFTVSINETDADPTNNTSVLAFTSGTTSDSVMARENETVSTIGLGFTGGTGRLANTYRFANADTVSSITVYFDGDPAGKTFELFIADYSNGVGSTELWNSGPISGISGANSFFTFGTGGVILPAGNYMIGVNQTGTVNIAVGLSTVVFRPATAFFGALGAFSPVESIGNPLFDGSFMIRPNFGPTPAVPTNNDDICNAIPTVLDTIYPGDNSIATTEVGEPTGTCFSDGSLDNTVWYSFVAPVSGTFRTSTDFLGGTNNDTQLAAYLSSGGCTGTLTQIGCDDDGGTLVNFNSIMDFSATAGQTVWIQVDGWNNPPAAAGTFSIQTTLLQLANQYDASLDNAVTEATGIGGYALVPNSQYNNGDVDFILNVENLGTTAVTGVTVNGSITPGGSSVTGSVATIAGFGSDVVSTNSFTASNTTSYTASFTVSINETDADPTNNTSVLAFTSGTTSDSVMARENETVSTIGLGFTGGTGRLANTYRFANADTVSSITVYFDGDPAGKTFELFIADYSNGVGSTELWNSGPISGISGANSFFTFGTGDVALPPGNYMIGVNQTGTVNIAVGLTTVVFRPGTAFFGALGAFAPVESIGNPLFDGSFMIRPNVKVNTNQATLADFNLLSPNDGSVVVVSGPSTSSIVMDWEDAVPNPATPVSYVFMLDTLGGDFSNPILQSPSDNSGADSELTLTVSQIETILTNLGYSIGDTLNAIWQVEATAGAITKLAVAQFEVSFEYGLVGIDKAKLDQSIKVYPNPTEGPITIEIENNLVNGISIMNSVGQIVKSNIWSGENKKVYDISDLASGIYVINFQTTDGIYSRRLIIQ